MIDNKDSNKRYRVDHLIEGFADEQKAAGNEQLATDVLAAMDVLIAATDYPGLKKLIEDNKIKCGISKTCNWTDIREFNLMFNTQIGSVAGESDTIYLRPETAQGIFVNFLNVQKTGRMKIPFGIAQTGKAFRNEIVARQFIFRMREFEQMEMQFFIRPGTQMEWYNFWKEERKRWHESLGIPAEKLRFHDHVKLAHYADAALDIEFEFPFGWKELEGIHSRTDFDLTQHQTYSKKKMQYFDNDIDPATGKAYGNYVPYVLETSVCLDRLFLTIISLAYAEEKWLKEDGSEDSRVVLRIPAKIAPTKLAILPLTKKEGLPEIAEVLLKECKQQFHCFYEEKDTIGKRYRRMDAIGTPFCVTIDHQTKEDNTVTIRYRDTMVQERIALSEVKQLILEKIS
jgi:glycyl-tRNA synthetase